MPELHIITGSNGAGKSTIGAAYLPHYIRTKCTVFDGDRLFMIKQQELWQSGITAIKEAKKLAFAHVEKTFDELRQAALTNCDNFVYEGHFTNEATWDVPKQFKAAGFTIHMIYFGLANTKLSELRVVDRTKEGGHYVDPVTVANNFYGNLQQLNKHFNLFDRLQVVDTSEVEHKMLAIFSLGKVETSVDFSELPQWFVSYLPSLAEIIHHRTG